MQTKKMEIAAVPMKWVGPLRMRYQGEMLTCEVPLATYETPLWPSTARGARVSMQTGSGIEVTLTGDSMTRSLLLIAPSAREAAAALQRIQAQTDAIARAVGQTTRHGTFQDLHGEVVGHLLFLRLSMQTGDAAGHNMVTAAAEAALQVILEQEPTLRYGSLSGNFCTDKKVSAVNGLLGRGRSAIAEILIPAALCRKLLRTEPAALCELNQNKNWVGSTLAGSLRSANAHVANILLALYLATGQDAANIVEGSQAMTLADLDGEDLRFSVTLPNLIVGTVGNGKHLPFAEQNLQRLGCRESSRTTGQNAQRLAAITAAAVLCGELSLLAALTNPGELMRAHRSLEREPS